MIGILLIIGLPWLLWELVLFGIGNQPSEETENLFLRKTARKWKKERDRLERKIKRKWKKK